MRPAATSAEDLLTGRSIRSYADQHDISPQKARGQNFVTDPNTIRRIVRLANVHADDVVLEVGPGLGSLTLALLDDGGRVVAVEIDQALGALLPEIVARYRPERAAQLAVVTGDALALPDLIATAAKPTVFVSNLPYNVSVPVLLRVLETLPSVRSGLILVQAEVADRIAAGPGSRTYGAPSAKVAWYATASVAGSVPRTVFWPVPNVDSSLVAFERRSEPDGDRRETFAVIDAAFAQRRKMLRTALSSWAGSTDAAVAALTAAGVDPTLRGEALGIDQFARIAAAKIPQ